MQKNILEYLEQTAPGLPQKIAYSNGTDSVCFADLHAGAKKIGSALLDLGCRKEAVAILMDKHPNVPVAFYGAVYAGCYYVPLDLSMPQDRLERILNRVGARIMIVDKKGEKLAKSLHFSGKVIPFDEIVKQEADEEALASVRNRQIDTDPIYVVFTSGSTGEPKGVVACHRSVIDYVEALSEALGFSEKSVFANQTPLFFDAPLKELMPVIKFGATAYFVPKMLFSFPVPLCEYLNKYKINTVCWVVSALTQISSLGALEKTPPKHLTTVAFGSEVFPLEQYKKWREALPNATFYNLYGPTEATGMSCYWRADRDLDEGEAIPIGQPFQNTDLLLIREDGKEAVGEEVGEIYLRGTCVTLGYYGQADKTAETFVQNPLHNLYPETVYRTGDLAKRNKRGELVFLCRRDSQIKHMGHRIELGEIEAAAARCDGVRRACCVYDAERKKIVLFYEGELNETELLSGLKAFVPPYMIPSIVKKMAALPLTPNGKLDRKGLLVIAKEND